MSSTEIVATPTVLTYRRLGVNSIYRSDKMTSLTDEMAACSGACPTDWLIDLSIKFISLGQFSKEMSTFKTYVNNVQFYHNFGIRIKTQQIRRYTYTTSTSVYLHNKYVGILTQQVRRYTNTTSTSVYLNNKYVGILTQQVRQYT